jgi:hypothetical protein
MDFKESTPIQTSILVLIIALVLFIIISHIVLLFLVGNLYNKIVGSILKIDMCGIRETEGDTVRYNVMKALQKYNKNSKWVLPMLIVSFILSFVIVCWILWLLFMNKAGSALNSIIDLTLFVAMILAGLVIIVLPIVDILVWNEIPKKIKNSNELYIKSKDTIVGVIKKITNKYGSFDIENAKHPEEVIHLYKLLLERWSSRNNGTIEDAKHALSSLSKNKEYEEIFTYLKLDSSLEDQEILKDICKKYIHKCGGNLEDDLDTFQIYLPQKSYKDFKKFVEKRLVFLLVILFIYLFPVFHVFYHGFGAAPIGLAAIAFAIAVIFLNYMQV